MQKAHKKRSKQITWMKDWMKNFRFSLSFRISLNYLRFFLINGILFFVIAGGLYLYEERRPFAMEAEQMAVLLELDEDTFFDYVSREHPKLQVEKQIDGKKEMLYASGDTEYTQEKYLLGSVAVLRENGRIKILVRETQRIYGKQEYDVAFYYDLSEGLYKMLHFLKNASVVYLLLALFVVIESKSDNKKVFRPIKELTETARTLTIANLHSERLPMKGTQPELRELTRVFNEMLDRLENSYESQKQFVSNASHELRTPIAVIQGYARMLERWGAEDPKILKEAIASIGEESKAMQELVEKLLFLSRHDRKNLKVQKEWFSMGEMVEDMVRETRMVTSGREIKAHLIQNVAVYGDDQLLKQAVRVLIDNAVKYSKEGDTITIGCENRGGNCILTVEDTGIGMRKEDVNHMFERFYRSDDIRGKVDGHGLGLSIARLIFLAHAGTIKVRTQYTVGTSFTVTLPRERMAPKKQQGQEKEG